LDVALRKLEDHFLPDAAGQFARKSFAIRRNGFPPLAQVLVQCAEESVWAALARRQCSPFFCMLLRSTASTQVIRHCHQAAVRIDEIRSLREHKGKSTLGFDQVAKAEHASARKAECFVVKWAVALDLVKQL